MRPSAAFVLIAVESRLTGTRSLCVDPHVVDVSDDALLDSPRPSRSVGRRASRLRRRRPSHGGRWSAPEGSWRSHRSDAPSWTCRAQDTRLVAACSAGSRRSRRLRSGRTNTSSPRRTPSHSCTPHFTVTRSPITTSFSMNTPSQMLHSAPMAAPGSTCANAQMRVPAPTWSDSQSAVRMHVDSSGHVSTPCAPGGYDSPGATDA